VTDVTDVTDPPHIGKALHDDGVSCPASEWIRIACKLMSRSTVPPGSFTQPPALPLRRFTVDEYRRMGETGVLTKDDRVELLEGWIVQKTVHNPPHDATVDLAHEVVRQRLPSDWRARIQSSITTGDSEPEPDLAVVIGTARTYASRHPGPPDIGLVIEVADSSLKHDRVFKGRIYSRAGTRCYWIVNLVDSTIEVYEDPSGPVTDPAYRTRRVYRLNDSVPLVLAGSEVARIPVSSLLPR
jgi:Uma2 family endonuclease